LRVFRRNIRLLSQLGLLCAAAGLSGSTRPAVKPFVAYHDGADILFSPQATGTNRPARFGPWNLGERLGADEEKPRDKRLNLYVVVPGNQYHSPTHPEYDHNLVVNKYTADGKAREWDIFWCLALDPDLPGDLRSERELLLASQQRFRPPEAFAIQDVPANAVLAEKLNVFAIESLNRYRHKDGSLPRMLIVLAHFAVRATAEPRDPASRKGAGR
jgi:hypothetical protein